MSSKALTKWIAGLAAAAALPAQSFAAEVIVWNGDLPGIGFNDPTPATPVGGNPGVTRGQQALNVFQRAADAWGKRLESDQTINVIATFSPLNCTSTTATLGAAGANWVFSDAPAAAGGKGMTPGTWYHAALAEKLTKTDLTTDADPIDFFEIVAFFNGNLGNPGCLDGNGWYFGLDNQQPSNRIDLLAVVLHEFGHGLGFSLATTNSNTGARLLGIPSVWESNMYDATLGKTWLTMTNAERAASARNDRNLVWIGPQANNNTQSVLDREIVLNATGVNPIVPGPAAFGGQITQAPGQGLTAPLTAPNDGGGASLLDGCEAYAPGALAGQIALVNRGAGTTASYPRLYAPTVFAQGSSVSHWDISMNPSTLMEPFITPELTTSVKNPEDLTRGLLRDIGW